MKSTWLLKVFKPFFPHSTQFFVLTRKLNEPLTFLSFPFLQAKHTAEAFWGKTCLRLSYTSKEAYQFDNTKREKHIGTQAWHEINI